MFTHALVRSPASTFNEGLTSVNLGVPTLERALEQHNRYCAALEACGLALLRLPPDPDFPDSTFVEDTAVITDRSAVLTRPGAPSRRGEPARIQAALARSHPTLHSIESPGTLEGGDVCLADGECFIGLSERTNAEGARQLGRILEREGIHPTDVDIRAVPGLVHLKTGLASLDTNHLVVAEALADHDAFRRYRVTRVPPQETYAANCVWVNGRVLFPSGFPITEGRLRDLGYHLLLLEMSEFMKMDGGLSCLSLRYQIPTGGVA